MFLPKKRFRLKEQCQEIINLYFFVLRQSICTTYKRAELQFREFSRCDWIRRQWRQSWSLLPPFRPTTTDAWMKKNKHVKHFCCQVLFTFDVTRSITFYQHMVFIFMNRYRTVKRPSYYCLIFFYKRFSYAMIKMPGSWWAWSKLRRSRGSEPSGC